MGWEETRVGGQDELAVRASKKMVERGQSGAAAGLGAAAA